jgi:hypothetical protein
LVQRDGDPLDVRRQITAGQFAEQGMRLGEIASCRIRGRHLPAADPVARRGPAEIRQGVGVFVPGQLDASDLIESDRTQRVLRGRRGTR